MNVQIARDVWALPEICQRWRIAPLDLYRAIMAGSLKPCVMLDTPLRPVVVVDGVATIPPDAPPQVVRKYLYAAEPQQIEPFNYRCEFLCDTPVPSTESQMWQLPVPLTLVELMDIAVCTAKDVAEAEVLLRPVRSEDMLSTKERNSLSTIVTAMSFELYGWEPGGEKSTGITDLLRAVEALGMKLSYNTAKKAINESWERAKPSLS